MIKLSPPNLQVNFAFALKEVRERMLIDRDTERLGEDSIY
jgi:hypothetical protein